tara:strand:+ start:694 stop:927 length:234 start_codon:yes stop_codon:yes gene_type:complete
MGYLMNFEHRTEMKRRIRHYQMMKKYRKELREQRAIRKENEGYGRKSEPLWKNQNQYMIAHGKIKMLNMIIKDLVNL